MNVSAPADPPTSSAELRRAHRRPALAIASTVGLLALTACTSNPGPSRVAEDIIQAETVRAEEDGVTLNEDCLLGVLENFSDDDLRDIADNLESSNPDDQRAGESALAAYELQLQGCR